jgi:hypothetical protein
VKKRLIPIYSILAIAIVLLTALAPSCGGPTTGTIVVQATLCGVPWQGAVSYTLTPTGGAATNGTVVPTTHSSMLPATWTCAYVSGGPAGAFLNSIKPSASQSLVAGGTITFTLDFELNQDAAIQWLWWSQNGETLPQQPSEIIAMPCMIIDAHFLQWVDGCTGYNVTLNETSVLSITQIGGPMGVVVYVVNDDCALNKTPTLPQALPPVKKSQVPSFEGYPVEKGMNVTLTFLEPFQLDVKTVWQLVKGTNYTKAINWFGISLAPFEPLQPPHQCVLFELVLPMPGQYTFQLQSAADVALVDDVDVKPANNHAMGPVLTLIVNAGP